MRPKPRIKAQSIDEYLAALSDDKRAVLNRTALFRQTYCPGGWLVWK
jgi:hypothetical protein